MWALFLFIHPDSKFFQESTKTRKELIFKDYLSSDKSFSWDKYEDLLKFIQEKLLTKAERSLMNWEKKLHERDEFINSLSYSLDTYEDLDKMMKLTTSMWDQYESIKDRLTKEKSSSTEGDIEESLSERKLI